MDKLLPVGGRLLGFRPPAAAQVKTPFRLFGYRMLAAAGLTPFAMVS
jgi:hypothetical protein